MATQGVQFYLTDKEKELAIKYTEDSGFFKNRLADFLGISRPTLDRVLEDDADFFTSLKRADTIFCKSLIDVVKKKTPIYILRTRYKEEFSESKLYYDPVEEIKKMMRIIDEQSDPEEE